MQIVKGFDSFRALAFFAVFFFHTGLLQWGYLGVHAFFVLSSFLITPILVDMKDKRKGIDFFTHFYGRRFLRIFPLYYFYLALVTIIIFVIINNENYEGIKVLERFLAQLPWALTYTYDFFHASRAYEHTYLVTHFWSLAIEQQFYLVWPFLIFYLSKTRLKMTLIGLIVLGPILRYFLFNIIESGMFPLLDNATLVIYVLPFSYIDAFAIGAYFALYKVEVTKIQLSVVLVVVLSSAMFLSWVTSGSPHIRAFGLHAFFKDGYSYIWGYLAISIIFASALNLIQEKQLFPLLMENTILVYLGKTSYGLYVYHFAIIWVFSIVFPGTPMFKLAPFILLVTIFVSSISYELLEVRILHLKNKYFSR